MGTTILHASTLPGPKVTNVATPEPTVPAGLRAEMGDELARAFCAHARRCAVEEAEASLLREEACFHDVREDARDSLEPWPCDPGGARVGFERCLAAIRAADCVTRVGEGALIPACRPSEICRTSNVSR